MRDHFVDGAVREQFAFGNISQSLAALGFIHVMRGNEKGEPLRGQLMNFFPEIAARFRIDTGGGLVQQQQFRSVNEAGRERETLFPAAGKLAGKLLFALGQPEFLDAFAYRLPPVLHARTSARQNRDSPQCSNPPKN